VRLTGRIKFAIHAGSTGNSYLKSTGTLTYPLYNFLAVIHICNTAQATNLGVFDSMMSLRKKHILRNFPDAVNYLS
jgi:hypothetical protein